MKSYLEKRNIKNSLIISFIALYFVSVTPVKAQYVLKEADQQYQLYNYIKAIDLYEQAYKKKKTIYAAARLAEAYALTRNYKQAESWYAISAQMTGSTTEYILSYARALIHNSKYGEAKAQLLKYIGQSDRLQQSKADILIHSCDSAIKWMRKPGSFKIQNEKALNSKQADWGAVKNGEVVTFTSDRSQVILAQKKPARSFLKFDGSKIPDNDIYGWTGNPYLRLYQKAATGAVPEIFSLAVDTEYHIGAASFTADGNEMYFTLTRLSKKTKYNKEGLGTINTEIFYSKKTADGKTWEKPMPFKFNKANEYPVGDPCISMDGKELYFVSDAPGGKGGMDIYVAVKTASGEWASPRNLEAVNTAGNERSPYLDESAFFFSSDGYVGMGDLDVFKATRTATGLGKPVNLGYPLNSPQDDFAFNRNSASTGYLSSNRTDGGMGSDDIYSFSEQLIQVLKLEGKIFNKNTGVPLASAIVTLKTPEGNMLKLQTDTIGHYAFKIDQDVLYEVNAGKTGFREADTSFITQVSLLKDLYLIPVEINESIKLENIYYNFNKSNIRPDAAVELDKLLKILNDNPTIWIEIGSHTDSRGNDQYNLVLSQKRANAAVEYLISKGVSKNRITGAGYGETKVLNRCQNGVDCTFAEHQLNRRTEFKITKQ